MVTVMEDKAIQLGETITLTGFGSEDGSTMVVVKKMVGNYVKKLADTIDGFQNIAITLKKIHQHEGKGGKNEIHVRMNASKLYTSEVTEFNLFVGLDKCFKKIVAESSA
ncbi:MAG: hypothetical protein ACMXYK_04605 [Candidatus Woesearchaeota archaeon]